MRLLVAGGAGFIGSAFTRRRLQATADEVVVVDKLTYAGSLENLIGLDSDPSARDRFGFVKGDIADHQLMHELVGQSDAVVNFAAESHVDRSILDATAFLRTGVLGVHALLEAVREVTDRRRSSAGSAVRFVQVSTDEVYGPVESGVSYEDDQLHPRSPYSAAKAAGELLVRSYRETYGLDLLITRGANTYGPRQHVEKFIPLFITNAIRDMPLPIYGDGQQRRDWLFVDDHADGIGAVLDEGESGEIYNIGADEERVNRQVAEAILNALGKSHSLITTVADRRGHDRRYAMDTNRIARLGWSARMDFETGIAATVEWYRQNETWWRRLRDADWDAYYERQYGWRLAESAKN
ncbi:MAG TPA: dTDP-glucose 4,6-dehydratase [Candidatus Limnocylindria bacterium]|nr:dTDP-glucose 4,6-dehydratase [Candidatus Limnocylindria bacterium]